MKRRDFLKLPALAALPILPALPAAAGAAPIAPAAASCRETIVVHLGGEFFSRNQVRDLISRINSAPRVVVT